MSRGNSAICRPDDARNRRQAGRASGDYSDQGTAGDLGNGIATPALYYRRVGLECIDFLFVNEAIIWSPILPNLPLFSLIAVVPFSPRRHHARQVFFASNSSGISAEIHPHDPDNIRSAPSERMHLDGAASCDPSISSSRRHSGIETNPRLNRGCAPGRCGILDHRSRKQRPHEPARRREVPDCESHQVPDTVP